MKKKILLAAMAAMVLLAGCEKDRVFTLLVSTENYKSADKAYIANNYACWENGDQIALAYSGYTGTGTITVNHRDGHTTSTATATGTFDPGENTWIYAAYPVGNATGQFSGINATTTSITLCDTYVYI